MPGAWLPAPDKTPLRGLPRRFVINVTPALRQWRIAILRNINLQLTTDLRSYMN